ncbi:MAG: anti-sigma F factor [Lachnospiraceae bacterium]|nr:anti-sigma F factor [Lachnospiraceae bacterium]
MRRSSTNICEISFPALSENESFARMAVSAFVMPGNPTLEELSDIKTAISEAVTNAILHGYNQDGIGKVHMRFEREEDSFTFMVWDEGVGIENVEQAMEPLYTSRPELERSGMGFSFMEAFMDSLAVESEPGKGTKVTMTKSLGTNADASVCDE